MTSRSVTRFTLGLSAALLLAAAPDARPASLQQSVDALYDETAKHLQSSRYSNITARAVRTAPRIPQIRFEDARAEAAFHKRMLRKLNSLDVAGAPHELMLEIAVLRKVFEYGAYTDEDYWLEHAVTPYTGGGQIINANRVLATHLFETAADAATYLRFIDDYGVLLDQMAEKTLEQAKRGIRVSRPAIGGAIKTFEGLRSTAPDSMVPDSKRLSALPAAEADALRAAVREKVTQRIQPACDAVLRILKDPAYVQAAPAEVGLDQYPGGKASYLRLLNYNGYGMTPEQIHQRARNDIADIERRMKDVRDKLGVKGTADEFHQKLRKEPQLVFRTPAELEKRYDYFMKRMDARAPDYFSRLPKTPYGYQRLDPAVDNGTRGGGGQRPTPADPVFRYVYPAFDLVNRSLEVGAAHRIYHEITPGHYFEGQLQREFPKPGNLRELSVRFGAYGEGWANYGASLAIEMGIMDDPYDLYLELLAQANGASRSVIDTGMNYLDMSLEEARTFLRTHSPIMSDVAIVGESLRFGADNFGQSVAYWMGFVKIWDARKRAEKALGARFNIKEFHAVVLDEGNLPMDALDMHVDRYIAQHRH
jgi:uncharacterized protein (DUF885 family)